MLRALLPLLLLPAFATAADFAVTRFDDPLPDGCTPTDCSLREAVNAAQAANGADRVLLPAGNYVLDYDTGLDLGVESGPLLLETPIEFVGAGRASTTITAAVPMPMLIGISLSAPAAAVTLSDLAIENVVATASTFAPVAVGDAGTLHVRRVDMRNNTGAVSAIVSSGLLTIEDSIFDGNSTDDPTGGVTVYAARGPLAITGSQFIDNGGVNGTLFVRSISGAALGTVTLRDNVFRGNVTSAAAAAFGLFVDSGLTQLDLSDSVFEANHAGGHSGAVFLGYVGDAPATTRLEVIADGVRFTDNTADEECGALNLVADTDVDLIEPPTLSVDLARFDGNSAGSYGGALCTSADTTIMRSTFDGNTATSFGGAIVATGPAIRVERSTISDNVAGATAGGVFALSTLALEHSTVHGNSGGSSVGGLLVFGAGQSLIRHSTIAGNTLNGVPSSVRAATSPDLPGEVRFFGSILQGACTASSAAAFADDSNYTVESPGNTCGLPVGIGRFNQRSVSGADLALGPLADNGGPTLTRLPADDSVARDPGPSSGTACTRIDQRGYTSSDTRCDAGSVEVAGIPPTPPAPEIFVDGFE